MVASKYLPHYKCSSIKWVLELYIFYSNQLFTDVSLWGLYKYDSKHKGSCTNIQANISANKNRRTDSKYIMNYTLEW